jgi:two-component system, NarL family, nitrate/nitrite response regulator NarL
MAAQSSSSNNRPIRLLLLDHHTLVRDGLRLLIGGRPGLQVVAEAGSSAAALELASLHAPDVILLELNLDGNLNIEIINQILEASNRSRIILVTGINENQIHQQAIHKGAMGVVRKTESASVLLKAIEKVHAGEVWIDRAMMADVLTHLWRQDDDAGSYDKEKIAQLSKREREIIRLIGQGLKNKQIADKLSISEITVRHHLSSVYDKLGVSDRLELTIFAYQNDLAELPL